MWKTEHGRHRTQHDLIQCAFLSKLYVVWSETYLFSCTSGEGGSDVLEAHTPTHWVTQYDTVMSHSDEAVIKGYCRQGKLDAAKEWLQRAKAFVLRTFLLWRFHHTFAFDISICCNMQHRNHQKAFGLAKTGLLANASNSRPLATAPTWPLTTQSDARWLDNSQGTLNA